MGRQLNAQVALILMIIGVLVSYYVLHANGWNLDSGPALAEVYRGLSVPSRAIALAGFVVSAYGMGALVNALLAKRSRADT